MTEDQIRAALEVAQKAKKEASAECSSTHLAYLAAEAAYKAAVERREEEWARCISLELDLKALPLVEEARKLDADTVALIRVARESNDDWERRQARIDLAAIKPPGFAMRAHLYHRALQLAGLA